MFFKKKTDPEVKELLIKIEQHLAKLAACIREDSVSNSKYPRIKTQ